MEAHKIYPDLVDKPKGHFFIEVGDQLYFCLVMRKHLTNLHQMNKAGLLSEENKKRVVEELVKISYSLTTNLCHGDIKESLKIAKFVRKSQRIYQLDKSRKTFW